MSCNFFFTFSQQEHLCKDWAIALQYVTPCYTKDLVCEFATSKQELRTVWKLLQVSLVEFTLLLVMEVTSK